MGTEQNSNFGTKPIGHSHSDFYIGCEYPTFYNTQYITFVLVHSIAAVTHSCLLPSFFAVIANFGKGAK